MMVERIYQKIFVYTRTVIHLASHLVTLCSTFILNDIRLKDLQMAEIFID